MSTFINLARETALWIVTAWTACAAWFTAWCWSVLRETREPQPGDDLGQVLGEHFRDLDDELRKLTGDGEGRGN